MKEIIYQAEFSIGYSDGEVESRFVVIDSTITSEVVHSRAWVILFTEIKVDFSSILNMNEPFIEEIKLSSITQMSSLDKKGNSNELYFKRRKKRKKATTVKKKTGGKGKPKRKTKISPQSKKKK